MADFEYIAKGSTNYINLKKTGVYKKNKDILFCDYINCKTKTKNPKNCIICDGYFCHNHISHKKHVNNCIKRNVGGLGSGIHRIFPFMLKDIKKLAKNKKTEEKLNRELEKSLDEFRKKSQKC